MFRAIASRRLDLPESFWIAIVLGLVVAAPINGSTANRATDPLILTGGDIPALVGIAPNELVAFRYDGGWQQIPVQVDERGFVDWGVIYDSTPLGIGGSVYTDAATFTGPDADPSLDADDEIVLMIRDAGAIAPLFSEPAGVVTESGLEVAIGGAGYVYLFGQDGTLDPAAGLSYVDYQFDLLSGDYKTTYDLDNGPNPENSTIVTTQYAHHFSDRWIDDELQIFTGDATGVDILDRHKNQFAPGSCVRTEDTFSAGEGAFVINKNGPVRAIRSYLGANSGPLTQREHLFYDSRHDIHTFLRVHAISGVVDYFDYSPSADGMTYANDLNLAGVPVDGDPDVVTNGVLDWEMVQGAQGSLIIAHGMDTDVVGLSVTSYYLDDSMPPGAQCTGDRAAYGASGPWINSEIPCTDPALCAGTANRLISKRTLYYDAPGVTVGQAADIAATARTSPEVATLPWIGSPGEVPHRSLMATKSTADPGEIELSWSAGCSTTAEAHAVYEGSLGDFGSHLPVDCGVSGTSVSLQPLSGDRYYLVVPVSSSLGFEGSYGRSSAGVERAVSPSACWMHVPHACP